VGATRIHNDDTEASTLALAAGVGFVAHLKLFDIEPDKTDDDGLLADSGDVLAEIDAAAVARSDAVRAVYDHLAGDELAHSPDELEARVDRSVGDDRGPLETLVFARLLHALAG
jgi:hypothetical protein